MSSNTWQFESNTSSGEWRRVEAPTDKTLYDVAPTRLGPVAVGGSGYVVARSMDDGNWGVLSDAGPGAESNDLRAVTSVAGGRVWFAGSGGALGFYDLETRSKYDVSEPAGTSETVSSLAAAGARGTEKLLIGTTGGAVLLGYVDGFSVRWNDVTHPVGSAAITAAVASPDGYGYVGTDGGDVFMTSTSEGWRRLSVRNASSVGGLAAGAGSVLVVTGAGRAYRYSPGIGRWTPFGVGGNSLHGVALQGEVTLAVGGSGSIYRSRHGSWVRVDSPVGNTLHGVTLADPGVAVGSGGVIVERGRNTP